jgi:ectoine hydroxylase-related dioxygenase (phytanoyl-CoA dioxygenase family)
MVCANKLAEPMAEDGFAIIPGVLRSEEIHHLMCLLDRVADLASVRSRGGIYAIRNLLAIVPEVHHFANSPKIRALVEPVLGTDGFPVRGLLFDKTPGANWKVPWHQDLSIAVRRRIETSGFGPWSTKAGIIHVQPPVEVLERMLAVRIHLDDCYESNGPVRVIPGSHSRGRLNAEGILQQSQTRKSISCVVGAGGVLLMRPLLLHASSVSRSPLHRRVIHLEFASCALPGRIEWNADT